MRGPIARLRWASFLILFVWCAGAIPIAHAADNSTKSTYNVTTSPVFTTLTAKPKQTVSTPLKVQNNAASAVELQVKLLKFKAYGKDGRPQLLNPEANDASVSWVHFSQTKLVAQPGAWNTVTMTIHPDQTAAFGYYYAVVFLPTNADAAKAQSANNVIGSSAVLILLDVQVPGEKRQLSLGGFKTEHAINELLPVRFTATVKNTGDIYGAPTGEVYITKNHKDNIAVLPINHELGNVLPGSQRQFATDWTDGFPAHVTKRVDDQIVTGKDGQPETRLSWDASKLSSLRFGRYYAHVLLVYNNGSQDVPIEAETSFWVIPWRAMLVALIPIGLIVFSLVIIIRRSLRLGRKISRRGKPAADQKVTSQEKTRHDAS